MFKCFDSKSTFNGLISICLSTTAKRQHKKKRDTNYCPVSGTDVHSGELLKLFSVILFHILTDKESENCSGWKGLLRSSSPLTSSCAPQEKPLISVFRDLFHHFFHQKEFICICCIIDVAQQPHCCCSFIISAPVESEQGSVCCLLRSCTSWEPSIIPHWKEEISSSTAHPTHQASLFLSADAFHHKFAS